MRRSAPRFLALLLLLMSAGAARAQSDLAARIPLDPAIRAGQLDNGLRYLIRANGRPENRAELVLVVNAGSVLESDAQRGLAHFAEHMAFNGTQSFAKQEIINYLESIGMRFGADLNAYTGFDETVYLLTVPTDTGTALERGIQILQEWAQGVTFDSAEVEKERGVVIEEWRLGQGASARLRDQIFPVLFRGSRYAERLPIGTRESLTSFRRDELVRFYRDWYRPDLMAVIAVGDFDAAQVERWIRQRFGTLDRPANAPERALFPVGNHTEPQVVIATDPEATSSSVDVYYMQPVPAQGTYDAYRRSLIENLHAGMLNSRFAELARRADPPFVGAGASKGTLVRTRAAWSIGAAVSEDGILRGLEAVLTEAERLRRHGFTPTELEREKRDLLRFFETAYAERDKSESSSYANEYIRHVLEGEAVPGIALEFELAKQYLPAVTLEEVNALTQQWMTDANRVIVVQAPRKDRLELPTEAELLAVFDAVAKKEIEPYRDVVAEASLVPNPPAPGRITGERQLAHGVTEWQLSNGARVLLKPTDFKADEVVFRAFSPGGFSLSTDEDYVSATFSSTLVASSGLGRMDATQLMKALAGKAVRVQPVMDELTEGLIGGASPREVETLLQLAWLHFTSPREDSTTFQSLMTRFRGFLENQAASPENAFSDTLSVTLSQHHVRARPVTVQTLDEIDPQRSLAFYRDRYADASDFTFVFVGSFQPDSLRPLVERWLAGLPGNGRAEQWRDSGMRPPSNVVTKVVRRGVEPKSQTAIVFTGPIVYDRTNTHLLGSMASVLETRLRDVLREELGGTYSVSVSPAAARDPWQHYAVTISFGSAPERADSLAATVFKEIEALQTNGPDPATLQKVQEMQRRTHETNLKENGWWLRQITTAALQGTDLAAVTDVPALIDALTPQRIAEAAREYLRSDRYVKVVLLPER